MLSKSLFLLGLLSSSILVTGCGKKSNVPTPPRTPYHEGKVTRENFINGRTFCDKYDNIGGREFGRYVEVPKDYANPAAGKLLIYVYSKKQFVPHLPTYINIDGGPGQNTHGSQPNLRGEVNELQFDQRGLGCSTADSFDEYIDARQYSTENTARDIEEIRKAYGISKITVYGISYGTVPATVYGSKFPQTSTSVVLEGVAGTPEYLSDPRYHAEKLNLVLAQLDSTRRNAISDLMYAEENSQEAEAASLIFGYIFSHVYTDQGFKEMIKIFNVALNSDGSVNADVLGKLRAQQERSQNRFPDAQQPMGVDRNIFTIIYCKDLGARSKQLELDYSPSKGFFSRAQTSDEINEQDKECNDLGVKRRDETPYIIANNKVSVPVYYFQGSHDGATLAAGAIEHWKVVPTGSAYFMLAKKGGHNPNLQRIESDSAVTAKSQQDLFLKAITAVPISSSDVSPINTAQSSEDAWVFYSGRYNSDVHSHLSGI